MSCHTCGKPFAAIACEECGLTFCWDHKHDHGTHHPAKFEIGQEAPMFGRYGAIVTARYPFGRRWKYDGFLKPNPDFQGRQEQTFIGAHESDLEGLASVPGWVKKV